MPKNGIAISSGKSVFDIWETAKQFSKVAKLSTPCLWEYVKCTSLHLCPQMIGQNRSTWPTLNQSVCTSWDLGLGTWVHVCFSLQYTCTGMAVSGPCANKQIKIDHGERGTWIEREAEMRSHANQERWESHPRSWVSGVLALTFFHIPQYLPMNSTFWYDLW